MNENKLCHSSTISEYKCGIDEQGWCTQAEHLISPNQNERPIPQDEIDLLVIHNITLPPGEFGGNYISDMFLNVLDCDRHPFFDQLRNLKVSTHFFIRRTGKLIQYVSTNKRAWHAGVSNFLGRTECNDFSIGIEIEGTDFVAFTEQQYQSLTALTVAILKKHPIKTITGHQFIAPMRKTDPGPFFNWEIYKKYLRNALNSETNLTMPDFWLGNKLD